MLRALSRIGTILITFSSVQSWAEPTPARKAQVLFRGLTGLGLPVDDARLKPLAQLLAEQRAHEAGRLATQDEAFYRVTLKNFSAPLGSRTDSNFTSFNDFQALIMGTARDDRDARELLTTDAAYVPRGARVMMKSNRSYENFEAARRSYIDDLERREPQWPNADFKDAAGLLTTRAWAEAHLDAGTNRRATERALRVFLCAPIETWKEPNLPDRWVRRDVDRAPAGNPATYQAVCRSCHALLDGLGGAYARFDFVDGGIEYKGEQEVARKMLQNAATFPRGYAPDDDFWINQTALHQQAKFGWRGATRGQGVQAFGRMLADSEAFKTCMSKRAFAQICGRDSDAGDAATVSNLAQNFEKNGYRLRDLFVDVALTPGCLDLDSDLEGKP